MIRRLALASLVACIAISGVAPRAFPQTAATGHPIFLWKVNAEGGGEVWLFGSIHAGTKDMYPLQDVIENAFAGSKKLVVEADIENVDNDKLQVLVFSKGIYPEGDSLTKHLKPETIAILRNFAEKRGIPLAAMERMRPWFLILTFSAMTIQDVGMDPELGLDLHFLKAAKASGKEVLELEGVERQLDVLASLPDAQQEANLVASLAESDKSPEQLPVLIQAWKNGDAAKMEEFSTSSMKEHPETKPAYEAFLFKRNENMTDKIEGYLKTRTPHFVVVGALHLVGDKGIVKLLEARKYKVEQVKAK